MTKKEELILRRFLKAQDRLVTQAADLSLGTLAGMVDEGAIDIAPKYQRRARWGSDKKSALIESFLLNIPVPPVYLAEDEFGRYSVVDGRQRLTAIADFVGGRFRLAELETFTELIGFTFSELPPELRNALSVRPFLRVITLLKQSDPSLKYEVFVRLNRGGEMMEDQEIRNVAFRGAFNELIIDLSKNSFLVKQLKISSESSSAYKLMADIELVLRFLTLRLKWSTYTGNLRKAMDEYMAQNKSLTRKKLAVLRNAFLRSIDGCEKIWGDAAFQRPSGKAWRDQFLNGMYDAQMLAVDELSDTLLGRAIRNRTRVVAATRALFASEEFDRAVREATNTPARLRLRVEKIIEALKV
jgi:hypothetical protein